MPSSKRKKEQYQKVASLITTIKQAPDADEFDKEIAYLSRVLRSLSGGKYSDRNKLCKVLIPLNDLFDEFKDVTDIASRRWALKELLGEVSYAINNGLGLSPKAKREIEGNKQND